MKTTEEMIAVMQAHVDGKVIETNASGGWIEQHDPKWLWGAADYRIKHEPLEAWAVVACGDKFPPIFHEKTAAENYSKGLNNPRIIRLVEADQ